MMEESKTFKRRIVFHQVSAHLIYLMVAGLHDEQVAAITHQGYRFADVFDVA